jgi:hypothetical protein
MGGMSRSEHNQSIYGYSWGAAPHGAHHQYHNAMPPVPTTAWGNLPRSIGGGVDSAMASSMQMQSNHMDYGSYDDSQGLSGPHHHHY